MFINTPEDHNGKTTTDDQGHTLIYDPGNRVSETIGGVTTLYLIDTNNLTGSDQSLEAKNTRPMAHDMLPVVPFHGDGKGSPSRHPSRSRKSEPDSFS